MMAQAMRCRSGRNADGRTNDASDKPSCGHVIVTPTGTKFLSSCKTEATGERDKDARRERRHAVVAAPLFALAG